MKPGRQAALTLALTALLLAAWAGVLRALPFRAHLAESNYESNLIRLQHALLGEPAPLALVGSSITGRLLPEYFTDTPVPRIANLGLDGGGPLLGLDLLATRSNVPPVVVIEANLLMVPEGVNDQAMRDAVASPGFRLAEHASFLRAEARPSSLVYAWLKRRKDDRSPAPIAASPAATPAESDAPAAGLGRSEQEVRLDRNTPEELEAHKARVYSVCRRLQGRGLRLILVRYPNSASIIQTSFHPLDFTGSLAEELKIRRIDLGQELRAQGHEPTFTDGTHLSAPSARVSAAILARVAVGGK